MSRSVATALRLRCSRFRHVTAQGTVYTLSVRVDGLVWLVNEHGILASMANVAGEIEGNSEARADAVREAARRGISTLRSRTCLTWSEVP